MEITMTPRSPETDAGKKKRRIKLKLKKKWIVLLVLAAVIVGAAVLKPKKDAAPVSAYTEIPVEYQDISVVVSGSSTVEPKDSYTVIGLVKGEILDAPFSEGDTIQKDDLLFQIDTSNAENNVSAAELAVQQAELNLSNAKISASTLQKNIGDLQQTTNYTGQITDISVDPGDTVAMGQVIAQLVDSKTMLLKLPFHKQDAANLSAGQSASVTMTATGETLAGTVKAVSAVDTVGVGGVITREVEIAVVNPGAITAGSYATALAGGYGCADSGAFSYQASKPILATASGEVRSVAVAKGDWVTAGQVILSLDSDQLTQQVDTSENAVTAAELSLKNAELSLDNAKKLLEDYTITSPISGTVVEKNFKTGDTLDSTSASSPMAVIYDLSELEFELGVDELLIGQVRVGQDVLVTADALPGQVFEGYVERMGIRGASTSGVTSYPVTIKLKDNETLLPGMNVTADIMIEQVSHVLAVPVSAVSRGNSVLVVDPSSKGNSELGIPAGYRQANVKLGRSNDQYVEIVGGLEEGDVIAIDTSIANPFMSMMTMGMG